jgi:legume-like lectin family protein/PEP-CTERM motif-containing protein
MEFLIWIGKGDESIYFFVFPGTQLRFPHKCAILPPEKYFVPFPLFGGFNVLRTSLVSRKSGVLLGLLAVMALSACPGFAQITGFGDGSNFTLSGYDQDNLGNIINTNDPPTISGGTLTITNLTQAQGRSAFFNTPQNISSFIASFTFQNQAADQSPLGAADGFAFVAQSQGLHAVGGTSAGLGYTVNDAPQPPSGPAILAIAPSAAEEFYLRNGTGATQFGVNGSGTFAGATPSDPVDLADGDPVLVTLIYDGTAFTLSETLTDLANPLLTYTLTRSADIQDVVGTTGFVGFTGATGGAFSNQLISNFTFSAVPEPTSIGLMAMGTLALVARRCRIYLHDAAARR